jgi:hypothetical protein
MQRYFSNEPPVYSKPKPQSGPPGSRPSQQDAPPRPPPPVPRPSLNPPPPIASPLASPSRPTPPPKPQATISSAIPHTLPPSAHTPHFDSHSPIHTQYHRTVSLDRDPVSRSVCSSPLIVTAESSPEATPAAASIFIPFTARAQPRSNTIAQ